MADGAPQLAATLSKDHKDFSAGRIELWGIALVRPNDLSYALMSAKSKGEILLLSFEDGSKLQLEGPAGLKATKDGLTIASATKGTWTEAGQDPVTAVVEGKKLHVTSKSSGTESRPLPKAPALFLGQG